MLCLMPIIMAGVIGIITLLTINAKISITEIAKMDLQAETNANALELGTSFRMLTVKFG